MPVLEVKNLRTYYFVGDKTVKAVDGVSFKLNKGEVLGLVGESGSGKTTIGLSLMKLLPSNGRIVGGHIYLDDGTDLAQLSEEEVRKYRWTKISMIFQGAMNSLNPLMKIGDQIAEVLIFRMGYTREEATERAKELLSMVGIDPIRVNDYPHQFSGGMKQRAVIAMALASNPEIVIADEPTTALDVTVQAQILEMIKYLKNRYGLSMIYITHDLSVVAEIADKIAIMYAGKIMEFNDTRSIFKHPVNPYTKGLIESIPTITKAKAKRLFSIPGDPPNLLNPPKGCPFWPRCPYAKDICKEKEPPIVNINGGYSYCHFSEELKDVPAREFWIKHLGEEALL